MTLIRVNRLRLGRRANVTPGKFSTKPEANSKFVGAMKLRAKVDREGADL
jgi:hypothetical protein